MARVWYVGTYPYREITPKDWDDIGIFGPHFQWSADNGWSVDQDEFRSEHLTYLAGDPEFLLDQEGVRPDTPMPPDDVTRPYKVDASILKLVDDAFEALDLAETALEDIHTSLTAANTAATQAGNFRNEAQTFRNQAEAFKNTADTSASTATTKAETATTKAGEASVSAAAAKTSETNAKTSETNSKTSETNSKTSETKAKTSETNAKTSETNAAASEGNAKTYRDQAEGFKNSAQAAVLSWKGAWSSSSSYVANDVVSHNGSSWLAMDSSSGLEPGTGTNKWVVLASKGDPGGAAAEGLIGALTDQVDASGAMVGPTSSNPTPMSISEWMDALESGVSGMYGALGTKADLDGSGKVPAAQMPDLAITEFLGTVASQAAMLGLSGQRGDWCVRTDRNTQWILIADNPGVIGSWREMVSPASPVSSVAGRTGAITLSKSDVGLSAVDNTSDLNKPISTATQQALNSKSNDSHTHTPASIGAEPAAWYGTQAQYDALGSKTAGRMYNIIEG